MYEERRRMSDKRLIKEIEDWLEYYQSEEEHDLDMTIELKDSAVNLFLDCVEVLKKKGKRNGSKQGKFDW
jgi:hypothetical protein